MPEKWQSIAETENKRVKRYFSLCGMFTTAGDHWLGIDAEGKTVRVHSYAVQSEADGQRATFYEQTSLRQLSLEWVLDAREGVSRPFAEKPAFLFKTDLQGADISLRLAQASAVNFEIVYSNDDDT